MRSISKLRAGTRGHTELLLHPPIGEQSPSNHYSLECLWRNPPATKKKTSQKWRRWSCGHKNTCIQQNQPTSYNDYNTTSAQAQDRPDMGTTNKGGPLGGSATNPLQRAVKALLGTSGDRPRSHDLGMPDPSRMSRSTRSHSRNIWFFSSALKRLATARAVTPGAPPVAGGCSCSSGGGGCSCWCCRCCSSCCMIRCHGCWQATT